MKIAEATWPVTEAGPNPYAETVAKLSGAPDGAAIKISLTAEEVGKLGEGKTPTWSGVERTRRQLREAGNALKTEKYPNGCTVKSKVLSASEKGAEIIAKCVAKQERKPAAATEGGGSGD